MILRMDPCPVCGTQMKDGKCDGCGHDRNEKKMMEHRNGCIVGWHWSDFDSSFDLIDENYSNVNDAYYFRYCPVCGKKLLDGE